MAENPDKLGVRGLGCRPTFCELQTKVSLGDLWGDDIGFRGTFKEDTITLVSPGRAHRASCDGDSRFAIPTFKGFPILWQPMSTNMILSCSFHNYSIMYSKTPF